MHLCTTTFPFPLKWEWRIDDVAQNVKKKKTQTRCCQFSVYQSVTFLRPSLFISLLISLHKSQSQCSTQCSFCLVHLCHLSVCLCVSVSYSRKRAFWVFCKYAKKGLRFVLLRSLSSSTTWQTRTKDKLPTRENCRQSTIVFRDFLHFWTKICYKGPPYNSRCLHLTILIWIFIIIIFYYYYLVNIIIFKNIILPNALFSFLGH